MMLKRQKFVDLAEARVSRALLAIRVIGNLSNRSTYEYSDEDVRKIVKALSGELEAMQARFRAPESKARPEFKLGAS
jgi:hypothetical protein